MSCTKATPVWVSMHVWSHPPSESLPEVVWPEQASISNGSRTVTGRRCDRMLLPIFGQGNRRPMRRDGGPGRLATVRPSELVIWGMRRKGRCPAMAGGAPRGPFDRALGSHCLGQALARGDALDGATSRK